MKSLNFNKLSIQKEDILSKTQMKNILGGHSGDEMGCYKCCWDDYPDSCSKCVTNDGTGPCGKGASIKSCASPCPYQ